MDGGIDIGFMRDKYRGSSRGGGRRRSTWSDWRSAEVRKEMDKLVFGR